jgi:hypothetical protein
MIGYPELTLAGMYFAAFRENKPSTQGVVQAAVGGGLCLVQFYANGAWGDRLPAKLVRISDMVEEQWEFFDGREHLRHRLEARSRE